MTSCSAFCNLVFSWKGWTCTKKRRTTLTCGNPQTEQIFVNSVMQGYWKCIYIYGSIIQHTPRKQHSRTCEIFPNAVRLVWFVAFHSVLCKTISHFPFCRLFSPISQILTEGRIITHFFSELIVFWSYSDSNGMIFLWILRDWLIISGC